MARRDDDPMEFGMRMARRMMEQMGQGANPMDMMEQMMRGARQGGGEKSSIEKTVGMAMAMLAQILEAMKQTNALAVHATPELQQAFAEWLKTTEGKVTNLVASGVSDSAEIGRTLGLSEASVRYILTRLAASGSIRLSAKAAD